jgi:hypothetical protein
MEPEAAITRVLDKHQCLYVYGHAKTVDGWRKASFVVYKGDIQHMSPPEFERFALRKLPHVIEGVRHEVTV